MSRRLLKLGSIVAGIAFLGVFYGLAVYNTPNSDAVKATDFKAGRIIDDSVFYNANTMNVAQIQAFLDRNLPACDMWGTGSSAGRIVNETGYKMPAGSTNADYARLRRKAGNTKYHDPPYVCVNKYYENPNTHETLYDTKGVVKSGMISATQIIYNEAKAYNINPQVLLVLLKKESYVWGDSWPLKWEYNSAMGYGCPDNAPCDTKYYGFYNQMHMAAWQLNYYREHINSYNYRPYKTNNIYYSPDYSCGTKAVYLENIATTSLYIYTPYTPNDAALRNYPGTSVCGSYGNRNFFMYFSEWFGSTWGANPTSANVVNDNYYITTASNQNNDLRLKTLSKDGGVQYTVQARSSNNFDGFRISKNSDKTYTIINNYTNKAVDVPGSLAETGKVLQQWEQNGARAQKWYIYDNGDGSYSFRSALNYWMAISVENGEIVLKSYDGSASQRFILVQKTQPLADGEYAISSALGQLLLLSTSNMNKNGANARIDGKSLALTQRWNLKYNATTGSYAIYAKNGGLLDVSAAGTKNGTNVQTWENTNACAQAWQIQGNSSTGYEVLNRCSGKALDVSGGSAVAGTNVQLWVRNNLSPQRWKFEKLKVAERSIADGEYIIANSTNKNFVVDVKDGAKNNGTNIRLWPVNGSGAQKFTVKYDSSTGYYSIVNALSGKYLDVAGARVDNGTNVQLWQNTGVCAQRWQILKNADNSFSLKNMCAGKMLDISGFKLANGTNIQVWELNGSGAQKWVFLNANQAFSASTTSPALSGVYEIQSSVDNGYAIDVTGAVLSDGTNVQLFKRNGTLAQKWELKYYNSGNYYMIRSQLGDKYLSVQDASGASGANVRLWRDAGTCAQKWELRELSVGVYTIASKCSDKVLDLYDASARNNSNIQVFTNNGTNAQRWLLVK